MLKSKKGDVSDMIIIPILLLFLAVALVVVAFTNTKLVHGIQGTELNSTDAGSTALTKMEDMNFDIGWIYLFIFGFLVIGIMTSSFMIKIHPVFVILYIFFFFASIFLSIILSNSYEKIAASATLAATFARQSFVTPIMSNIVKIMVGVNALSMVIIFSKIVRGGEGSDL